MKTSSKSSNESKSQSKNSTGKSSKTAQGLHDLFEDQLKDIFWAEKALTKAIPRMIKKATSEDLIKALENHLEVTKVHVERIEQIFELLGKPARAKKCPAMEGLITEGEEIMEDTEDGVVRDAGIIAAAQKIEHYEIASYGTLCAFAKTTGEMEIVELLQQTLNEEKEADETLTRIAEASINEEAHEEQSA